MNDPLDTLLRDPRAHGDAPDAQQARAWGRQAVARWRAERLREDAAAPASARRDRWQDLVAVVGLAAAAAAVLPVLVDLGAAAWARWQPLDLAAPLHAWLEQPVTAPLPWLAGAAVLLLFSVPQLRGLAERLLDG